MHGGGEDGGGGGGLEAPVAENPRAGGGIEFGMPAGLGDIHGGGEPLRGDGDADADAAGDAALPQGGRIGWPRGMYYVRSTRYYLGSGGAWLARFGEVGDGEGGIIWGIGFKAAGYGLESLRGGRGDARFQLGAGGQMGGLRRRQGFGVTRRGRFACHGEEGSRFRQGFSVTRALEYRKQGEDNKGGQDHHHEGAPGELLLEVAGVSFHRRARRGGPPGCRKCRRGWRGI